MRSVTITIQSMEDVEKGKPIFPGKPEDFKEAESFHVGILENGTVGGQTTLYFISYDPSTGKAVGSQMTGNQFEMLIGAFRGAVQRFGK